MMRFGAAMGEDLPLRIGNHQSKVRVLDEAPGWIGDRDQEGEAGTLGLGAGVRLRKGRRYRSYEGDHEKEPFAGNREQFNAIRMREIREDLEDSRPGGRSWRVEPADDANAARL